MSRFKLGDNVELSLKGRRFLKRRVPEGYVVGINPLAIKVKFLDTEAEAEWWEPTWFQKTPKPAIDGIRSVVDNP